MKRFHPDEIKATKISLGRFDRQDLSAKLKADFQRDLLMSFLVSRRFKDSFMSKREKIPKRVVGLDGVYSLKRLVE